MQNAGRKLNFEGYVLDLTRGCLQGATGEIELRPKIFELLRYLVENAGRLLSKDELLNAVWPNVIVTDNSLAQCVSELRHALNDSDRRMIKTVPRRGYVFAAIVSGQIQDSLAWKPFSAVSESTDHASARQRVLVPALALSGGGGQAIDKRVTSIDSLAFLIDAVYGAALDPQRWPDALSQINAAVGANVADLKLTDFTHRRFTVVSVGMDPVAIDAYKNYYGRIDPILPAVEQKPVGTLVTDQHVVPKKWFTRTEFYNDWARPQDIHDCAVLTAFRDDTRAGVLCLAAPERAAAFDAAPLELLRQVAPHLERAMRVTIRVLDIEALRAAGLQALDYLSDGIILVTSDARVVFANRMAETMLARFDGIGIDASGLCAASSAQTVALHRLIARCARREDVAHAGGSLQLERPSRRGRPISVTVVPMCREMMTWGLAARVIALVLLTDPESDADLSVSRLRRRHALTRAEAKLAEFIAKGSGVEAAARALGIAASTARTHLHRVFDKTGARRQAELAHLVNQTNRLPNVFNE